MAKTDNKKLIIISSIVIISIIVLLNNPSIFLQSITGEPGTCADVEIFKNMGYVFDHTDSNGCEIVSKRIQVQSNPTLSNSRPCSCDYQNICGSKDTPGWQYATGECKDSFGSEWEAIAYSESDKTLVSQSQSDPWCEQYRAICVPTYVDYRGGDVELQLSGCTDVTSFKEEGYVVDRLDDKGCEIVKKRFQNYGSKQLSYGRTCGCSSAICGSKSTPYFKYASGECVNSFGDGWEAYLPEDKEELRTRPGGTTNDPWCKSFHTYCVVYYDVEKGGYVELPYKLLEFDINAVGAITGRGLSKNFRATLVSQ